MRVTNFCPMVTSVYSSSTLQFAGMFLYYRQKLMANHLARVGQRSLGTTKNKPDAVHGALICKLLPMIIFLNTGKYSG